MNGNFKFLKLSKEALYGLKKKHFQRTTSLKRILNNHIYWLASHFCDSGTNVPCKRGYVFNNLALKPRVRIVHMRYSYLRTLP